MAIVGEPTHLVLHEDELYRMDEWLDERVYNDENARKFGYIKVSLHESVAGQCSTGQDFISKFGPSKSSLLKSSLGSKLSQSFLFSRPYRKASEGSLYLCKNVQFVPDEVGENFFAKALTDENFLHGNNSKDNGTCCTRALETAGEEGYITHLEEIFKSKSVPLGLGGLLTKPSEKSSSAHERQIKMLKRAPPNERAFSTLLAMQTENVKEGPSSVAPQGCECVKCKVDAEFDKCDPIDYDGFVYCANIEESASLNLQMTQNVRMSFLSFCNMLSFLPEYFNGISYPALYMGVEHSLFTLHIEDMSMWSFNFLHAGYPKYWLIIPPRCIRQLNALLEREGFGNSEKFCSRRLLHKGYAILPRLCLENGIPYKIEIQRKGEGIILLPNAAHTGANLGVNLAEACNLGTPAWLPYGCQSDACSCTHPMVHADLSNLIKKFGPPGLLQAYKQDRVHHFMANDEYFQQSSLVPLNLTPTPSQKRIKVEQNETPVECPVCRKEWKSSRNKRNIKTHLKTYHSSTFHEEKVQNFIHGHNLKLE